MKWSIWVEPNKIFEEEYPNGWDRDEVMTAASNRWGGKVTNVAPACIGGDSDDDDNESSYSSGDLSGNVALLVGLFVLAAIVSFLPYIIGFGAIALICWGVYKLIKWIFK